MVAAKLDSFEKAILSALQQDARLTTQELAEKIGLSGTPCWRRTKALEEAGIIRQYVALLDPRKIGLGECVFLHVTLRGHANGEGEVFEKAVCALPEVLECHATMGEADYLLRVAIPSIQGYGEFLQRHIFGIPGVAQIRSNASLRQVKSETALPLDYA
ncbi:Lrp/AsnC family transcriptional regulator [Paramagnetospirillum caucaseum]|uniref:Lrp/AsnC family transcriptional regulator n=1 Tax=Paramagnetospirillum caucaseum TaxID=1244869 RepID=UPI00034D7CBD|nr:Lrp/AsnC family transcriptional regulator [Paramagnetospirillum caucaseum]